MWGGKISKAIELKIFNAITKQEATEKLSENAYLIQQKYTMDKKR